MTDEALVARLLAAIKETERDARDAVHRDGDWSIAEQRAVPWGVESDPVEILDGGKPIIEFSTDYGCGLAAEHVVRQSPAATLRRCEADKRVWQRHEPFIVDGRESPTLLHCTACSEGRVEAVAWPCAEIDDLADRYSLTTEEGR